MNSDYEDSDDSGGVDELLMINPDEDIEWPTDNQLYIDHFNYL